MATIRDYAERRMMQSARLTTAQRGFLSLILLKTLAALGR
jgi:hypothetical protein